MLMVTFDSLVLFLVVWTAFVLSQNSVKILFYANNVNNLENTLTSVITRLKYHGVPSSREVFLCFISPFDEAVLISNDILKLSFILGINLLTSAPEECWHDIPLVSDSDIVYHFDLDMFYDSYNNITNLIQDRIEAKDILCFKNDLIVFDQSGMISLPTCTTQGIVLKGHTYKIIKSIAEQIQNRACKIGNCKLSVNLFPIALLTASLAYDITIKTLNNIPIFENNAMLYHHHTQSADTTFSSSHITTNNTNKLFEWHVSEPLPSSHACCSLQYPVDGVEVVVDKDASPFPLLFSFYFREETTEYDFFDRLQDKTKENFYLCFAHVQYHTGMLVTRIHNELATKLVMEFVSGSFPLDIPALRNILETENSSRGADSKLKLDSLPISIHFTIIKNPSNSLDFDFIPEENIMCRMSANVNLNFVDRNEQSFYLTEEHLKLHDQATVSRGGLLEHRSRDDFGLLLDSLHLHGTSVEIGVQRGYFSYHFLSNWRNGGRHVMVDPWAHDTNYYDAANLHQQLQDEIYNSALNRVKIFGKKIIIMRTTSEFAAKVIPNDSIDFVYIDARHDYYNAMLDMRLWWSKVKEGGVLAGHDYDMHGVQFALHEFVNKMNQSFQLTNRWETNMVGDAQETFRSWYIIKQ